MSSSGSLEVSLLFTSSFMGMYGAFALSGQAFDQEKLTGTLETLLCGTVTLRQLWLGKILGTLLPAAMVAYAAAAIFLYRGPDGAMLFSVQLAVYLALILPALLTAFIGVMGFVQLHFDSRRTRMISIAVMALIGVLLLTSPTMAGEVARLSWEALAIAGLMGAGLTALPYLLVNRLSKERIIMTSEG
jgi:ABC-type Na+ efflux pump permease subunit